MRPYVQVDHSAKTNVRWPDNRDQKRRAPDRYCLRLLPLLLENGCSYLPIIRMVNEPNTGVPWPPRPPPGGGGGAGPRSCDIAKRWPVLLSNVTVRAPFMVGRFCSTSKLAGLFSLTMVIVPLPWVLKASIVAGLNAAPSEPPASGRLARILPSVALKITIMGCAGCAGGLPYWPQAAKITWFFTSSASPLH